MTRPDLSRCRFPSAPLVTLPGSRSMSVPRLFAFALLGMAALAHGETPVPTAPPGEPDAALPRLAEPLPAPLPAPVERQIPIEVGDDLPPLRTIDLTTPPDDLWQRVRNGFSMPDLVSPLVADRQAWYLNRPEMLAQILERSRRYLYHIVAELEKRGMPTELALLPIVESAYNPLAYSSARALGIWQFIPSTGKNYRLEQNWWFDQRRDIVASTSAALDYLQYIYEMHGDWHLALASYNWGEHAVARAIAKNQAHGLPTDYEHLKMPGETRYYVPKLQALKNIIAHPELFHIKLDPVPNRPYFGTVARADNMDVSVAAKLAEIPVDEFIALNPAYNRPMMPVVDGSPLVLPADKVDTFVANLERYEGEDKPLSDWQTYTLRKGERIDAVASRFGLSGARLRQINGISARTRIGPGHALLVPGKAAQGSASLVAAHLPVTPEPARAARHAGKSAQAHGHRHGTARKARKGAAKKARKRHR
jgi:membrane-bound lytic murein transglycosylase D